MDRHSLTDTQWDRIEPLCLGKKSDPGRTGGDTRLFLEAVLWIARTGSHGATCPSTSVAGTRSSSGFVIG